jgi:hypothetical protein
LTLCIFNLRIIESVETFAALVPIGNQTDNSVAGQAMFNRENFAISVNILDSSAFQGQLTQAVSELDVNNVDFNQVNFTQSGSRVSDEDTLASVFITQELFEIINASTSPGELPRLIFVINNVSSPLFQDRSLDGSTIEGGAILSVRQSAIQNPTAPADLEEAVMFQFQTNRVRISIRSCCPSLHQHGCNHHRGNGGSRLLRSEPIIITRTALGHTHQSK